MTGWLRPIEQVVLQAARNNRRVVGVTAPHLRAGVSTVSKALAEMSSHWGARTLLIDVSAAASKGEEPRQWAPGFGDPRLYLQQRDQRYDLLEAVPSEATLGAFNSVDVFRKSLVEELDFYAAIVVDLPPIVDVSPHKINPLIAAFACDALVLVCLKGQTTTDAVKATMNSIHAAGITLAGTVLNDAGGGAVREVQAGRRRLWWTRK